MNEVARDFWEKKILRWERARYSTWLYFYPPSWPIRSRLNSACKFIFERVAPSSSILELGCGSGLLAEKLRGRYAKYLGVDIAENAIACARRRVPEFQFKAQDVLTGEIENRDLTVFLGLTDWLDEGGFDRLMTKIKSRQILFSYTRNGGWEPYKLYRLAVDRKNGKPSARNYDWNEIQATLNKYGYKSETLTSPTVFNPGILVWATKQF